MRSQFDYIGPVISEHYLYLASFGFVTALVIFLLQLPKWWTRIGLTVIFVYFISTVVYNNFFWRTEFELLSHIEAMEKPGKYAASRELLGKYQFNRIVILALLKKETDQEKKAFLYERLGWIDYNNAFYMRAIDYFNQSLLLNPRNGKTYRGLGLSHFENSEPDKAINYLEQASKLKHDPVKLNFAFGKIHYAQKDFEKAKNFFHDVLYLNPDHIDSLLHLGMIYFITKDFKQSDTMLDKALSLSQKDSFGIRFIASELYGYEFYSEALKLLEQSKDQFPHDIELLSILAKIYYNVGKKEKSISYWKDILSINPQYQEALKAIDSHF